MASYSTYSTKMEFKDLQTIQVMQNVWPSALYVQSLYPYLFETPQYNYVNNIFTDEMKLAHLFTHEQNKKDKIKQNRQKDAKIGEYQYLNPPKWARTAQRFINYGFKVKQLNSKHQHQ